MSSPIIPQVAEVRRYVTDDGRVLNALDRARNLHHYARLVGPNHYRVYSENESGTSYDVLVTASGLRCNCKAGHYAKPCKHAAKVGLRLQREGDSRAF